MSKLICGVGVNSGFYPATVGGKTVKQYSLWKSMLHRVYNPKFLLLNPTYVGCEVSLNFKDYTYFHDWCNQQVGFGLEGFQLDKDLLFKGNKVYSEDTCVFIPSIINSTLWYSVDNRLATLAEKYKLLLDPRAYHALKKYQVEITD